LSGSSLANGFGRVMLSLPKPNAPEPLLLTVVEAGRVLSVGRTTVYELIAQGELRTVHIGRACRVPVASVADYVERQLALEDATPPSYGRTA
jgi:excisionase family DNA binding protein